MFLLSLQSRIPASHDGIMGSAGQQEAAAILMYGHSLGVQPTRGRSPLTAPPSGYSKPFGGQNPATQVEDNTQ